MRFCLGMIGGVGMRLMRCLRGGLGGEGWEGRIVQVEGEGDMLGDGW